MRSQKLSLARLDFQPGFFFAKGGGALYWKSGI
jgi:hypothetical protein